MKPAPEKPVRLSEGHCCVCHGGVCHHIGGVHLCERHRVERAERRDQDDALLGIAPAVPAEQ